MAAGFSVAPLPFSSDEVVVDRKKIEDDERCQKAEAGVW